MHSVPRFISLGLVTIAVLAASACSPQSAEEPSREIAATEVEASSSITIWLDEKTAVGATSIAEQFEADTGVAVVFRISSDLLSELQAASPTQAIDVLVAPHGSQPQLLSGGFVQALATDSALDRFIPGTAGAFSVDGVQYGIPLSHENIALACVAEAMPSAPKTFEELVDAGLVISMNDGGGDPYHLFPIQSSFGAMVFQQSESGSGELQLALSSPENLAFATWLGVNAASFDLGSNTETAKSQLSSGDKACWLTGPWNRSWFDSEFGEAGWNAFPVPSAGLQPSASFLEVRGAMVSASSQNKAAANDFVTDYLGGTAGQVAIFNATGFPPSNLEALEQISGYKFPYQFGMAGVTGIATPTKAAMEAVWYPWSQAQVRIIAGVDDPERAWLEMVDEINSATG